MSIVLNNKGPGSIEAIVVNGKTKWKDVKFEKTCKIVVGKSIEIDGEMLFKAGKKDNFYCTTVNSSGSTNSFF
jgi:hypothetical protein